jgi:hypothetical protein
VRCLARHAESATNVSPRRAEGSRASNVQARHALQTVRELIGEQSDLEKALSRLRAWLAACDSQTGGESGVSGVLELR